MTITPEKPPLALGAVADTYLQVPALAGTHGDPTEFSGGYNEATSTAFYPVSPASPRQPAQCSSMSHGSSMSAVLSHAPLGSPHLLQFHKP